VLARLLALLGSLVVVVALFSAAASASAAGGTMSHRKLLQETSELPILSPLVPINWFIFGGQPTNKFNISNPIVRYLIVFTSSFMRLNAFEFTLFGDFPVLTMGVPQFTLFGGRGFGNGRAGSEIGLRTGAPVSQLASWIAFQAFAVPARAVGLRMSLFSRFGFEELEELGIPSNLPDLWSIPYNSNAASVALIDDSFVNYVRSGRLAELLLSSSYPGFYGTSFSSI